MNIVELLNRPPPIPWEDGETIPWHEPEFSQRMLQEHLSQVHDLASRRDIFIQHHVEWIHRQLLNEEPSKILELGCGPGLYLQKFAASGHICKGIDFSPASIVYAKEEAAKNSLDIKYIDSDLRTCDFGQDFALIMLIFGQFNIFSKADARNIVKKAYASLKPGGILLLEPSYYSNTKQQGTLASSWYTSSSGLFSSSPHLCLKENFWLDKQSIAMERYYILHLDSQDISYYLSCSQAYSQEDLISLLREYHFKDIVLYPSLGNIECDLSLYFALSAKK